MSGEATRVDPSPLPFRIAVESSAAILSALSVGNVPFFRFFTAYVDDPAYFNISASDFDRR